MLIIVQIKSQIGIRTRQLDSALLPNVVIREGDN